MEAKVVQRMHFSPVGSVQFSPRLRQQQRFQVFVTPRLRPARSAHRDRWAALEVSCSSKDSPGESGDFQSPDTLRNKAQEIKPYLNGRSVYLVGMLGSGKSIVGKVLAEALGYSFSDSDSLVEQAVNGTSLVDIFNFYGEGFFRDKETEVMRHLSPKHRLVVSTGDGVVTSPVNWSYMEKSISVWLDVPVEALAQRIAAAGIRSNPLASGDAYQKAFKSMSTLLEEQTEAYKRANVKVSLAKIAKSSKKYVLTVEPGDIAFEALEQIEHFLKEEGTFVRES